MNFSEKYPHIHWWMENHGDLDIGHSDHFSGLVRLTDEGGIWWEDTKAKTFDDALANAEAFLIKDIPDRFGKDTMENL